MVADEVAPAPALEGVVEGEGLAAVVTHLEPEADHLVVVEDRRLASFRRRALREPLRQIHARLNNPRLPSRLRRHRTATAKMLSARSGRRGGKGRKRVSPK